MIPKFLELRRQNKPLTVYGDGNQTRGYTHVSMWSRPPSCRLGFPASRAKYVLNIGPREETSVNEIAAIIGGPVDHIFPNPQGRL